MSESKQSFASIFKKKLPSFGLCFAIVAGCLGTLMLHYSSTAEDGLISQLENRLLDLRFTLRGERKPTGKIGILAIDNKSLEKFGRWPIARKNYEKAFANLKKAGAEWIGFDVLWSEPERPLLEDVAKNVERLKRLDGANWTKGAKAELAEIDDAMAASRGDRALAQTLKSYEKIVLGYIHMSSKYEAKALGDKPFDGLEPMVASAVMPEMTVFPDGKTLADYPKLHSHGILANTEYIAGQVENFAYFNGEVSIDAIYRWVQLVRGIEGNLMPSLSLKLAAKILGREPLVVFNEDGIEDITLVNPEDDTDLLRIPADHEGRVLINHLGPKETILHFSLADAYDGKFSPEVKKQLKGMSFILGPTAIGINDMRANPFDGAFDGVEQHAAVVDNIVAKSFMRRDYSVRWVELGLVLGIGLLFSPFLVFGKALFSGAGALLFMIGYFVFDRYFWFDRGEWVYMGMPFIEITSLFLTTTLYKYVTEEREKKKVKGTFGHYLSPEVMNYVLENPEALKLGGNREDATVFFSDVRGFTTISEGLAPDKLGQLMNDYFTPMEEIIMQTKGVIDKYIGDAIMAFWGAPFPMPSHPEVAAGCAIEMLYALDKIRVDFPKKNFPPIDIGIGLNSGQMSIGNFGSPRRLCYTAMGDAVNLGARIEGLTKDYGIKLMITEFTHKRLSAEKFFTRDLDDIRVKGKLDPVKVFELIRPDLLKSESALRNLIGEFELARVEYRKQNWAKAKKHLMACLTIKPDDGPSEKYMQRIEEYEADKELKPDWDGVYTFKHK